jgi:hypothetical protein
MTLNASSIIIDDPCYRKSEFTRRDHAHAAAKHEPKREAEGFYVTGGCMEPDWLKPGMEWGLRTWVTLALLCLLPIALLAALFATGIP